MDPGAKSRQYDIRLEDAKLKFFLAILEVPSSWQRSLRRLGTSVYTCVRISYAFSLKEGNPYSWGMLACCDVMVSQCNAPRQLHHCTPSRWRTLMESCREISNQPRSACNGGGTCQMLRELKLPMSTNLNINKPSSRSPMFSRK